MGDRVTPRVRHAWKSAIPEDLVVYTRRCVSDLRVDRNYGSSLCPTRVSNLGVATSFFSKAARLRQIRRHFSHFGSDAWDPSTWDFCNELP